MPEYCMDQMWLEVGCFESHSGIQTFMIPAESPWTEKKI